MKRSLKKFLSLALTVAMVFVLASCGKTEEKPNNNDTAEASDSILIGGIGPITGDAAMYGNSTMNGAKLAVDEINEAGGVLGKKLVLEVMDDKNDAVESTNAFNKLVENKIVSLVGAVTSKPSDAVALVAADTGIPMITPTGTAQSITTHGENIFRAPFIDPYQGEVMAVFAKDELKVQKVAVIRNNSSDYSDGLATAFVDKAKELGLEVVADESYGENDVDFKSQLTKIQNANPDVLFIPDYYQKVSLIAPQARQVGINVQLIGGDGWDGVIKSIKQDDLKAVEGAYFCNTFALDDPEEKVQNFIKKYTDTYNEAPQSFSALGYDSVYLTAEAIKNANSTDSKAIVEALKNISYDGVTGSFKFDENRNPIKSVFMTTIEGDQYKLYKKMVAE